MRYVKANSYVFTPPPPPLGIVCRRTKCSSMFVVGGKKKLFVDVRRCSSWVALVAGTCSSMFVDVRRRTSTNKTDEHFVRRRTKNVRLHTMPRGYDSSHFLRTENSFGIIWSSPRQLRVKNTLRVGHRGPVGRKTTQKPPQNTKKWKKIVKRAPPPPPPPPPFFCFRTPGFDNPRSVSACIPEAFCTINFTFVFWVTKQRLLFILQTVYLFVRIRSIFFCAPTFQRKKQKKITTRLCLSFLK